jgi:hypothetical protein
MILEPQSCPEDPGNQEINNMEAFVKFVMSFPSANKYDASNKIKLFKVWDLVKQEGGFEKIYEFNMWKELEEKNSDFCETLGLPLFDYFRNHLLSYVICDKLKDSSFAETIQTGILQRPLIYESMDQIDYFSETFRNATVVIVKNSFERWGLDRSLYSDSHITSSYGSRKIRIIDQNPLGNSFKVRSKEMHQKDQYMTIREYMEYRRGQKDIKICSKELPKRVKFAVNVDINSWTDIMEDLQKKIPSALLFKSNDDILSFLRQEIEGITIPQIYLKVAGCWTGGHEENLRIRAVNINTGDGDVEWYFVDPEFVPLFRKTVIDESKIDIHKEEGLWYTDLFFCLRHNIPVIKYIQKPGDTVILRAGTLHWVRSLENTSNVAWNLGMYELQQLELIYSRYVINNEIVFNNLLPVKTLFLDLLNCSWRKFDSSCLR